jgi:hypothetical protein
LIWFLASGSGKSGVGRESLFAGDGMIAGVTKNSTGTLALEPAQ